MEKQITTYKVKAGYHSDGTQIYKRGETFTSEKPLHEMFAGKFEIVATELQPVKSKKEGDTKKKTRYPSVKPLKDLGRDVTQKFEDAINKGYRVFQNGDGEHFVTSEDDLYTPINKKPMSKVATRKYLQKMQ